MQIRKEMIGERILYEAWPMGGIYDAVILNVSPKQELVHFSYEHNGGGRIWVKAKDLLNYHFLETIPKAREKSTVRAKKPRTTTAACKRKAASKRA